MRLVILITIFVPLLVFAKSNSWLYCQDDNQCILSHSPCRKVLSIAKSKITSYQKRVQQLQELKICKKDYDNKLHDFKAVCQANKCKAIANPKQIVKKYKWVQCKKKSDCIFTTNACNMPAAVNKSQLNFYKKSQSSQVKSCEKENLYVKYFETKVDCFDRQCLVIHYATK